MNTKIRNLDAAARGLTVALATKIESKTGIKPKALMWLFLGKGTLLSLVFGPALVIFFIAAAAVAIFVEEVVFGHDALAAYIRFALSAVPIVSTLAYGVFCVLPMYFLAAALWVGAAYWKPTAAPTQ